MRHASPRLVQPHVSAGRCRVPAIIMVLALCLTACQATPPDRAGVDPSASSRPIDLASDWWAHRFASTTVNAEDPSRRLEPDTRIVLTFEQRDDGGVIRWDAGCNTAGAPVVVGPRRLMIGAVQGTAIGCTEALARQDAWLERFFAADPTWQRSNETLTLATDDTTITFTDALDSGGERDADLPFDARFTGYRTDGVELWFAADDGQRYAYLVTGGNVERWPRARDPIGCA